MTALAANKIRSVLGAPGILLSHVGVTSAVLYEGALLCFSAAASTVTNAADTASFRVAGVYRGSQKTIAAGETVELERGQVEYFLQDGNLAAGSESKNAIILDNATMTNAATATNDVPAGTILKLDGSTGVWVHVGVFAPTNA